MTATNKMAGNGQSGEDELHALTGILLGHPSVRDCVVRRRATKDDGEIVVAYVEASPPVTVELLAQHARAAGSALVPAAVVRVSSLPLRDDGEVDEVALFASPVIDEALLARYRAALQAAGNLELVAEWFAPDEPTLRVDEILPETPAARATATRADGDADASASLSVGDAIDRGQDPPARLADLLVRAAERHPTRGITAVERDGEHFLSYRDLLQRAEKIMNGLRAAGLRPGDPAIFQLERNLDFISAFWGCVLGGFVPAPLVVASISDPTGAAATKLKNVWELIGRPPVLTSADNEAGLGQLRSRLEIPELRVWVVERLPASPSVEPAHPAAPDDLGLFLFTSGSTGLPKAVTQTQSALLAACAAMAQRNGFGADDVVMNWIGLDHVGGIVMCHLMFVALGARQVHARTDYILEDILRWLDCIDRHRATFTWAPNFAYALVNDRAEELAGRRWDLSSMGFFLNGGEAVVPKTARRFLRLLAPHGLPGTAMHPAWGMSETCAAATFAHPFRVEETSDTDALVEVGPPDPGFEIRIADDRGNLVPAGVEGRLEVRGPNVTRGYWNNPEANAESFTPDGWFRTGDLGKLRKGSLTITGREKGVIIVNGVNYYAHEIEAAVEDVSGVTPSFSAAFAAREPGAQTDDLAVAFHAQAEGDAALADLCRRIRAAVLDRVGIAPRFLLPVAQDDIPKTSIGKIQRPALTKQFERGGFADLVRRIDALSGRSESLPSWFYRPLWRKRRAVARRPLDAACVVVLLADAGERSVALERAVAESGAALHRLERADLPGLARVVAAAPPGRRLIVLGELDGAGGPEVPAAALAAAEDALAVVQAIVRARTGPAPCELLVYDTPARNAAAGDGLDCAGATAAGILATAPQEHLELSVRQVHLPDAAPDALARIVLAEIADTSREPEVAYDGSERRVRRLARRPPVPSPRGFRPGRTDGFYLVTGGLGGIGAEICRHFLRTTDVPLLLIGRHPAAAETLAPLEAGGTVRYEIADVADRAAVERAVAAAAGAWGRPLAGVLHLAGAFEPRLLEEETPETLAAALEAKVRGTWNLHQILLGHPDAALIAFSSVNGFFGGASAGAYAAANAFIDAVVNRMVARGRIAHSLGWSLWDGVGMSRRYAFKEPARRRGFAALSLQQGLLSFLAAAGSEPGQILIGLDGAHPDMRRHMEDGILSEGVTVRGAYEGVLPLLVDRFGTPVPHRARAAVSAGQRGAAGEPAFGNDLERTIAAIWREVLPSSGDIGPDDNFFDAGGTSVLVGAVSRKLGKALGRDVPMTDIYRFPTLRLLANHCGGGDAGAGTELDASEQRGQARRAARLKRRPKEL